jgi:hypothetical protein
MDKEKFDYYWKIALLVVLILGTIYMFWEFKQINKQGIECHSNPFEYGVKEAEKQGIACYYSCAKNDFDRVWNTQIDDFP